MKKVFTLLALTFLLGRSLFAQCNPDTEAPALVTVANLTVSIFPTKMVAFFIPDLVLSVQDNCSGQNEIQTSVRKCGTCTGFPLTPDGQPVNVIVFTCDNLGVQLVEVWARDAAGNTTTDTVTIIVQDNASICSGGSASDVSCARTELNVPVADVYWDINGGNPALPPIGTFLPAVGPCLSNVQGIAFGGSYTVVPTRDNDPLNGVSTFDLVLINKHILGKEILNSPYKMLAADANNSRSITTFDIVELRKLILGIYQEFPNHTSWGFVPKSFVFPNPNNPFQTVVPNTVTYADAAAGNGDFVAYKVGDVNGNVVACNYLVAPESRSGTPLQTEDHLLMPGETARLAWRLPGVQQRSGLQFSLQFDPEVLDITGVALGPGLSSEQAAEGFYALPEPGVFNFSWNETSRSGGRNSDEPVLYLDITAAQAIQLSQAFHLSTQRLRAEAYTPAGDVQALQLAFTPAAPRQEPEIFPAAPNPSAGAVFIPVNLIRQETVSVSVFDLSGKQLYSSEQVVEAGFHRLEIPAEAMSGQAGVLAYRVQAGTASLTGKLYR